MIHCIPGMVPLVNQLLYRCLEGQAIFTTIDLNNRNWVYLEGLTVENPNEHGYWYPV